MKYLGLQLDEHLKWKVHTDFVIGKLAGLIRRFYQIRDILSYNSLRMVYISLAESMITYCILIWGGLFQDSIKNLYIMQKGLLKILFKKDKSFPSEVLFSEISVLSVRQLYAYRCLMWAFDSRDLLSVPQGRSTRNVDTFAVPFFRSTHLQRFVFFHAPKLFNSLPPEIKTTSNKHLFKKKIIKHLLTNFKNMNTLFSNCC